MDIEKVYGRRQASITDYREELVNGAIKSVLKQLTNKDIVLSKEFYIPIMELAKRIKSIDDFTVPDGLEPEVERSKRELLEFMTFAVEKTRTNLERILRLYDWLNRIEVILNENRSTIPENINEETDRTIKSILSSKVNRRISTLKSYVYQFNLASDIEFGEAFHLSTSGVVSSSFNVRHEVESAIKCSFAREIYRADPYREYEPEVLSTKQDYPIVELDEPVYDIVTDSLTVTLKIEVKEPSNLFEVSLAVPAKVEEIRTKDDSEKVIDISSEAVGTINSNLDGLTLEPTLDFVYVPQKGYLYEVFLPNPVEYLELELSVDYIETALVEEIQVVSAFGEVIRTFTPSEVLLFTRKVPTEGRERKLKELLEVARSGTVNNRVVPRPYRKFKVNGVSVFRLEGPQPSKIFLRQIQSEGRIREVRLFAGAYDTGENLKYYIGVDRDRMLEVTPYNYSTEKHPRSIKFEDALPSSVYVAVEFTPSEDVQVIHSLIADVYMISL